MLQSSLLFLHIADENKNYNEELELKSVRIFDSEPVELTTLIAICTLISLFGIIGNGLVLWLLCYSIRRTKFTIYVANLTAGDFIIILCSCIYYLQYYSPFLNNRIRQLILIVFFFGHETNSYFLAVMSTERCLTIFSPVWYQSHREKCPTTLICALLWTMSVMISMLDHFLCTDKYRLALNIGTFPCKFTQIFNHAVIYAILIPSMAFSTLALFIRMKRKPQPNLPARLDISILATVVLHLIFYPAIEITGWILGSLKSKYPPEFYYVTLIFFCLGSSVNPFIYLLVGSWKREKGQEPFCMFLDRALKDERKERMRTQPDQEQA